jgi:uncharacterized protein
VGLKKISEVGGERLASRGAALMDVLKPLDTVGVAFSGGVDSSLLLAGAFEACRGKVIALTASSPTYPRRELEHAKRIASLIGARHRVVRTKELDDPRFAVNPLDRCYHCKKEFFLKIKRTASGLGFETVVEGSTVEDLSDFRPGERALRELGITSPLRQADLTKREVRDLAKLIGLPNWDKPQETCLATRFPYGIEITRESLSRIERLEDELIRMGFAQVRARYHGDLVRIEVVREKIELAGRSEVRDRIVQLARREGFRFVTLDLQGYRSGSLNP